MKRGRAYFLVDLRREKDTWAVFGSPYEFTGLLTRAEVIERQSAMKWADVMPIDMVGDQRGNLHRW